jgi:hypothetical protein
MLNGCCSDSQNTPFFLMLDGSITQRDLQLNNIGLNRYGIITSKYYELIT